MDRVACHEDMIPGRGRFVVFAMCKWIRWGHVDRRRVVNYRYMLSWELNKESVSPVPCSPRELIATIFGILKLSRTVMLPSVFPSLTSNMGKGVIRAFVGCL